MLVVTLASYYSRKEINDGYAIKDLVMPIVLTGIPFVLILLEPDLGTALDARYHFCLDDGVRQTQDVHLCSLWAVLALAAVVFAWEQLLKPYQKQRIATFLNPEKDPMGHGYQVLQSKIAVGSGGKFGKGYMEGTQGHLHFLPERHTDFAFSVWGEEWGFAGSVIFIGNLFPAFALGTCMWQCMPKIGSGCCLPMEWLC